MSDFGSDVVAKRKKRLQSLLGAAHYALGGEVEEAEMSADEDEFLSEDDDSSEIDAEDPKAKAKARLFSLMAPKFKKK